MKTPEDTIAALQALGCTFGPVLHPPGGKRVVVFGYDDRNPPPAELLAAKSFWEEDIADIIDMIQWAKDVEISDIIERGEIGRMEPDA